MWPYVWQCKKFIDSWELFAKVGYSHIINLHQYHYWCGHYSLQTDIILIYTISVYALNLYVPQASRVSYGKHHVK